MQVEFDLSLQRGDEQRVLQFENIGGLFQVVFAVGDLGLKADIFGEVVFYVFVDEVVVFLEVPEHFVVPEVDQFWESLKTGTTLVEEYFGLVLDVRSSAQIVTVVNQFDANPVC